MILEALVRHYDRLEADPESGVASYGYSLQQVGFCIVLNRDGSLHAIEELTDPSSDKPRPIKLVLPGQSKPSGSGINPCFLWDNPTYMLGFVPDGRDAGWAGKRFEGFRDKHLLHREPLSDDEGFLAVCTFLQAWDPATLEGRSDTEAFTRPGFGVFRLRGAEQFVHESEIVDGYWRAQLHDAEPAGGKATAGTTCLATGERGPVARLHEPKIKGVKDAQSSGATLVSFNENAYESLGFSQGEVAPVSERAAFQYATALNALLADLQHRVQLGDSTVVFWTEKPKDTPGSKQDEPDPADALAEAFGVYREDKPAKDDPPDEGKTRPALQDFLSRYRQGKPDPTAARLEGRSFYVLGLSPNAARISVRFWMSCSVKELAQRLEEHVNRVKIFDSRSKSVVEPDLRELLRETGRETKDIPPQLAGELARAILLNCPYPAAFGTSIIRRIKADQANDKHPAVNAHRASGLKAWLNRNHNLEVSVALDPERTEAPYLLGRLFAAYERVQQDAMGQGLNRTIRDSYLSSASATPGSVFPRLFRLNQHHFNKLRREKPWLAVNREKLIGQINQGLTDYPRYMPLPDQGLFAIGYYHQTQDFFTKKEPQPETNTVSEDN